MFEFSCCSSKEKQSEVFLYSFFWFIENSFFLTLYILIYLIVKGGSLSSTLSSYSAPLTPSKFTSFSSLISKQMGFQEGSNKILYD